MIAPEVWFPYLGIKINKLNPVALKYLEFLYTGTVLLLVVQFFVAFYLLLGKQKEQIKTLIIILTFYCMI